MFAIVTDTSANLDCSLLQQRNIAAIPFTFFVGGQEQTCTDTAGFDGPAFYDAMRARGIIFTSSRLLRLSIAPFTTCDEIDRTLAAARAALGK